jgi:hypothetical protein
MISLNTIIGYIILEYPQEHQTTIPINVMINAWYH